MILIIDHNDSFTNNLVSWFQHHTKKNVSKINYSEIGHVTNLNSVDCVIFSPGPGHPLDYPNSLTFYRSLPHSIPFLGVCLGHQIMLSAHGGNISVTTQFPIHGRQIEIQGKTTSRVLRNYVFNGTFVLYNSLGCLESDPVFQNQMISLQHENKMCLVAEHRSLPHIGVQFHPESFASSGGHRFLSAFLETFSL